MTGFTREQAAAIQQLRRIWPEEQFVVVGATAIGCHLEFRWRKTHDLDLCIAADIEECRHALLALPGWSLHDRILHAWTAPGDVRIDVVPASVDALRTGRIDWPDGGTMNAVGLRAAFADSVRFDVGNDTFVRVASPSALAILKMAAFLDRPDRERDLADLAHLIERVVGHDDGERWSDVVLAQDLDYDLAGPFLFGRRVGVLTNEPEREIVERFLARLVDPGDRTSTLSRMARHGPLAWREDGAALERLDAFRAGLVASAQAP